ncbi:MAG TPA: archease [Elusimicrobiota bacterium]|nr:archease [Elusimicrobiota bacterium]
MRLKASASSIPALFEQAAAQLLSRIADPQGISRMLQEKIVVQASDESHLLQALMSGLLSLVREERILINSLRLSLAEKSEWSLKVDVWGELWDPASHPLNLDKLPVRCAKARVIRVTDGFEAEWDIEG